MPNIRTLYIYVNKDMMLRGYFSKPKGFREQKDDMICLLTAIGLPPGAVVQYTFTHKQYTERHKTNNT
jgi:hypothetical protein